MEARGNVEPVIRAAEARDAPQIAHLVLLSDSGLLPALFGPSADRVLTRLAAARHNPFSYEHVLAASRGDELVGIALGMKQRAMAGENLATVSRVIRVLRFSAPACLYRLVQASSARSGLGPADFYLSNIAVNPLYRSSGLGGWLLGALEDRLSRQGVLRVVLDCAPENTSALRFYYRHGYEDSSGRDIRVRPLFPGSRPPDVFAFRRMVKRL